MSQERVILSPAPTAAPLIMAMVGLGISCRSRDASCRCRTWFKSRLSPDVSLVAMAAISPPAQKARPAPVMTTQPTLRSAATSAMAVGSDSIISSSKALSFSGRFRRTVRRGWLFDSNGVGGEAHRRLSLSMTISRSLS